MNSKSILIVEDEATVAEVIRQMLANTGYAVSAAVTNIPAALEEIARQRPDMVLMDIKIEGPVDGIAGAELMQKRASLPVIFLTAYGDAETLEKAKQVNPYGCLVKPFSEYELRCTLEIAFQWHSQAELLKKRERELESTYVQLASMLEAMKDKESDLEAKNAQLLQVAQELQDTDLRYERLVRAARGFIFTVPLENGHPQGSIHYPGSEDVTGYSKAEYEADDTLWYRMIHAEDREKVLAYVNRVIQGLSPPPIEHRILHKDGTLHWLRNMSIPHYDAERRLIAYDGLIVDITEIKKVETQRDRWLEELKRSNQDLEQFSYAVSHDLQEPLRMVASYVQLLQRRYQGKLDADADEFIRFAQDGAVRMQQLIGDLLHYSRLGRNALTIAPVRAQSLVDLALVNLKASVEASGATIACEPLPEVMADSRLLMLMFQNLIGNAIKFHGKAAPNVRISAKSESQVSTVSPAPDGGARTAAAVWQFSIQDNGIGIAPQFSERIFLIFQRLHTLDEYPGSGIGLTICKKIVERHGGRIWVESQPGRGSTFHFTLPRQPPNKAGA
ncbi:MAG: response regulator [Lentisphaerae bacterium]|nr:response regulator [Lentisphaerota bacterium]